MTSTTKLKRAQISLISLKASVLLLNHEISKHDFDNDHCSAKVVQNGHFHRCNSIENELIYFKFLHIFHILRQMVKPTIPNVAIHFLQKQSQCEMASCSEFLPFWFILETLGKSETLKKNTKNQFFQNFSFISKYSAFQQQHFQCTNFKLGNFALIE